MVEDVRAQIDQISTALNAIRYQLLNLQLEREIVRQRHVLVELQPTSESADVAANIFVKLARATVSPEQRAQYEAQLEQFNRVVRRVTAAQQILENSLEIYCDTKVSSIEARLASQEEYAQLQAQVTEFETSIQGCMNDFTTIARRRDAPLPDVSECTRQLETLADQIVAYARDTIGRKFYAECGPTDLYQYGMLSLDDQGNVQRLRSPTEPLYPAPEQVAVSRSIRRYITGEARTPGLVNVKVYASRYAVPPDANADVHIQSVAKKFESRTSIGNLYYIIDILQHEGNYYIIVAQPLAIYMYNKSSPEVRQLSLAVAQAASQLPPTIDKDTSYSDLVENAKAELRLKSDVLVSIDDIFTPIEQLRWAIESL